MKCLVLLIVAGLLFTGCSTASTQSQSSSQEPQESSSQSSQDLTPSQLPDSCGIVQLEVEISTPEQLVQLAQLVASGDESHSQVTYRLTADLDMTGVDFSPIGGVEEESQAAQWEGIAFRGILDGQGHTIENLSVSWPNSKGAGLIGRMGSGGIVKNLTLKNPRIEGKYQVAALVGENAGGLVENCRVIGGEITGLTSVGGLVGSIYKQDNLSGEIRGCSVEGTIITGHSEVGGLVGATSMAYVVNCRAVTQSGQGAVRSVFATYPLAAGETKESLAGQELYVYDEVDGVGVKQQLGWQVGGFVGSNNGTRIENCYGDLPIQTLDLSAWVGSFAGYNQGELASCVTKDGTGYKPVGVSSDTKEEDVRALSSQELGETEQYPNWDFENTWTMADGRPVLSWIDSLS